MLTYCKQQGVTVDPSVGKSTLALIETMKSVSLQDIDDGPNYRW